MGIGKWLALDELAQHRRLTDHAPPGSEVARQLFVEHHTYGKDCEGKSMPEAGRYTRMASSTSADNTKLVVVSGSILAIENETVSTTKALAQNNSYQP